jgi:hypothetical protein
MNRLRASIPAARIARYDAACQHSDVDGVELYRWANSVALAVFDDLGNLEVAMRSAMARELAVRYGIDWYKRTDLLDEDTLEHIAEAWANGHLATLDAAPDVVHGKLVATLMFGFWVRILGRGGYQGEGSSRARRIYDTQLWKPALRKAFPEVGDLERARVETAARHVRFLRNRIAHHEHIVWGVPIVGERSSDGAPLRLSLREAHGTVLELAGYVSKDLRGWLDENSRVRSLIDDCPIWEGLLLL